MAPRLRSVVFDCADHEALARFYASLLAGRFVAGDEEWCEVHLDGLPVKLAFQRVAAYRPPEWPDGLPPQMHVDLTVDDLAAETERAVALGARQMGGPVDELGCCFVVFLDPAGHPFCLCAEKSSSSLA